MRGVRAPTTYLSTVLRPHCSSSPANPQKQWDKFYTRHQNKFFKDRHYLKKDWGKYFEDNNNSGCSASPRKVVLESRVEYNNNQVHAFVCDVTYEDLCDTIKPSSVDVVTLVFMLSAVCPEKMPIILQNIKKVLKPKGYILVRDYAVADYAQGELHKRNKMISDNFYVRGDGTYAFYFSEEYLLSLFRGADFNKVHLELYSREIHNRSHNITMYRRWLKATFSQLDDRFQ